MKMIDVGLKLPTRRRAVARGTILMAGTTVQQIKEGAMPKGDVLGLAQAAGIMAAKKTPEILPLCHPLPLESVQVRCHLGSDRVEVECEAIATAKTGVEMEALMGVQAALLCIYDMTKAIDSSLKLTDIYLQTKEGGKSDAADLLEGLRAGIITVSDRCFKGEAPDQSGPALADLCRKASAAYLGHSLVPDEIPAIQKAVRSMTEEGYHLILLTGGTGLSLRDVTPEAIEPLFTKRVSGIEEMLRAEGSSFNKSAYLSRLVAGLIDETLVIALPGSLKAVQESWLSLKNILGHALHIASGGGH